MSEVTQADGGPRHRALDPRARTAILGVALIGIALAIGATAGWGFRAGLSVEAGALIAVANLYGLSRIVGGLLGGRSEGDPGSGIWGVFAILKIVGLFGGVWLLLGAHVVEPMAFIVGWGALPIGVTFATLFSDKSDRPVPPRAKEAPPKAPGAS
jgi:hypothetical protein